MHMLSSKSSAALIVTTTVLLAACGGGGDGGTPPPTAAIAANSGDDQRATVGQPLANPIQVVVTENGSPSTGVTVTWSTTAGGSLTPPSGPTGADGVASTGWTLGTTSGSQTASATLTGATGSPVTFTATAIAGPAAAFAKAGGDAQTGQIGSQLALPVQARVTDQFGNGVPEVDVGWAASGGTTLSAGTVATNAAGISAVRVTLGGTAEPITITATAGGLTGPPLTFTATATAAPTTGAISLSNNSFSPSTITVAAGTTVVWTWSSAATNHNVAPDGTMPTRSGPLVNGPTTYEFRFDTPGTYGYHCELHGAPGSGMSGTVIVQ